MITISHQGSFKNTEKFLRGVMTSKYIKILEKYGQKGVDALASATPKDSGKTASCWDYEIRSYPGGISIVWTNSNTVNHTPVAILLQYGHATLNGGYVMGRDFINPALRPIFDKAAKDVWEEVTRA